MQGFMAAARLLPPGPRAAAERMPDAQKMLCEELRLRRGRPITAVIGGSERAVGPAATGEDILYVTEMASRASMHAAARELAAGYLSAAGGVRVGVCGAEAGEGGLRDISSLAIRVPRAVQGCADAIWDDITAGGFTSLLILSPPGAGKTTLLRELIRRLSEAGLRVGVADERGEIANAASGVPGFDVGPHTDVMTGVPKARAAMMLIRSMSPQALAMDEITDAEDSRALLHAAGCGVSLLATIHGRSIAEVRARPACKELFAAGEFRRYVLVENHDGSRRYHVGKIP